MDEIGPLSIVLSVIGGVTGVAGMIMGFLEIRRNRYLAVNEFLTKIESEEFIETKNYVYNNNCKVGDKQASEIVNFFHHWGLLAKRKYLPMWIFDGAVGNGACRLYKRTEKYIEEIRGLNGDEEYGKYFEWLYDTLTKKRKAK